MKNPDGQRDCGCSNENFCHCDDKFLREMNELNRPESPIIKPTLLQIKDAEICRLRNAHEELLAALHEARYLLIGHGRRSDMIDKAIAKAEGQ